MFSPHLKPFGRRIRLVRAWRGLAIGACAGAGLSAGWAFLDWVGVFYTDWRSMGILTLAGALAGSVSGFAWPIAENVLTRSIDRRANLDDRLATATERSTEDGPFDAALRGDAEASLHELRPKAVYPLRFGRWQGSAMALGLLAAAIFLLGNSPFLMSSDAKKTRESLKQEGEKVQRITRESFETPDAKRDMSEAEKKLADELRKYQRDLEKARMTDEESLQRANDLAKQANDLMRKTAKESEQTLDNAQQDLEKMQRDALAQAGMPNVDPSMAQMTDQQAEAETADAQAQLDKAQNEAASLQSALDALMQKLKNPKLSPAERKALEAQKKALEKKLSDAHDTIDKARKDLASLKMSKEAREIMKRMMANPLYKQLQELAKKLKNNADAVKDGERPQITDAERAEIQRKFDELMKELKDPKAMEAYLKHMLEAMEQSDRMGRMQCLCMGFNRLVPIPGTGAPGNSIMLQDIGKVNHSDKALPSQGKTQESMISGMSRPSGDQTPYVEIKAPATMGNRSAVPYVKVLPSYRRKAESALDRQEIPKEDEKRVRAYFESLGH